MPGKLSEYYTVTIFKNYLNSIACTAIILSAFLQGFYHGEKKEKYRVVGVADLYRPCFTHCYWF